MIHEKIIKREGGDILIIQVNLQWDLDGNMSYGTRVYRIESSCRKLSSFSASIQELFEAKMELWNKLKPTL